MPSGLNSLPWVRDNELAQKLALNYDECLDHKRTELSTQPVDPLLHSLYLEYLKTLDASISESVPIYVQMQEYLASRDSSISPKRSSPRSSTDSDDSPEMREKMKKVREHEKVWKRSDRWTLAVALWQDMMKSLRNEGATANIPYIGTLQDILGKEKLDGVSEQSIENLPKATELFLDIIERRSGNLTNASLILAEMLVCLQHWIPPEEMEDKTSSVGDSDDLLVHLEQAFTAPFYGSAPDNLHRFVQAKQEQLSKFSEQQCLPYYSLSLPIVQSSGTGKTRMVIELGKKHPLLYLCLRKPRELSSKQGFPLGDDPVARHLEMVTATVGNSTSQGSRGLVDLFSAAFIGAWLHVAANKLEAQSSLRDRVSLQQGSWLDLGDRQARNSFFREVLSYASELRASFADEAQYLATTERGHQDQPEGTLVHTRLDFYHCVGEHFLRRPTERYAEILLEIYGQTDQVLTAYVAIDECVELIKSYGSRRVDLLTAVRRAWRYVDELHPRVKFWLLLLSTNSGVAELAKPIVLAQSFREVESTPTPVFVATGFDLMCARQEALHKAIDASQLQHIRCYGRPLWFHQRKKFWTNAEAKLLGGSQMKTSNNNQLFNVLASRFAMQLVNAHHNESGGLTASLAVPSVDKHMRILRQVTEERTLMVVAFSEPVLALVANNVMITDKDQQAYRSILQFSRDQLFLSKDLRENLGSYGELFARILLSSAWDAPKYVECQNKLLEERMECLCKPMDLQTWLKGIVTLTQPEEEALAKRLNHTCSGARQAWINFTHFDHLEDSIDSITPHFLWYCWKRGVAIQTEHSQDGIDGIIPVFLGPLDEAFESMASKLNIRPDNSDSGKKARRLEEMIAPRYMTYVCWQVKRKGIADKLSASGNPKLFGPRIDSNSDSWSGATKQAMLALHLDLRSTSSFTLTTRYRKKEVQVTGSAGGSADGSAQESAEAKQDNQKNSYYWLPFCHGYPEHMHGDSELEELPASIFLRNINDKSIFPALETLDARNQLRLLIALQNTGGDEDDLNSLETPLSNTCVGPETASCHRLEEEEPRPLPEAMEMDDESI